MSLRPGAAAPSTPPAARWVGALRVASAALVLATLGIVYGLNAAGGDPRVAHTFGYFTNLTNLLASLVMLAAGLATLRGRPSGTPLTTARAAAASCLVIVGLVYNLIVPGTGTAPPWASVILHAAFPVLVLLDWLLVADRPRLPWRTLCWVLPYPLAWLAVTLLRGAPRAGCRTASSCRAAALRRSRGPRQGSSPRSSLPRRSSGRGSASPTGLDSSGD